MKKVFCSIILLFMLTGCATIMNGKYQKVQINSSVAEARIQIFDREGALVTEGTGDLATTLKRGKEKFTEEYYTVKISTPDGMVKEIKINSELSMCFPVGNLFSWGIAGWIIDGFSEAKYKLVTDSGEDSSDGIKLNF